MESILIIDDDLSNAILCQKLLAKEGYGTKALSNASEALALLETTDYDLMLTDIRMPDMDGFKLIEAVREIVPEIGILIMTGYGTMENAVQALHSGADGLILKPIDKVEALVESVNSVLGKRRNRIDSMRLHVLRPLFDISGRLFEISSPEKLREQIYSDLAETSNAVCIEIYEKTNNQGIWECKFCHSTATPINDEDADLQSALDRYYKAAAIKQVLNTDDLKSDIVRILCKRETGEILAIPITREKKEFIFILVREQNNWWSESDIELFTVYANQAAIAIENAELHEETEVFIHQLEESQSSLVQAEKLAALGRLMATLAHELNNPLQGVSNCIYLASRPDVPEEQRLEYLQLAEKEVSRISRLAQNTKDHYRSGQYEIQLNNLSLLLVSVIELIKPQLRQNHIDLNLSLPGADLFIPCADDALRQVFLNIFINAIDELETNKGQRKLWVDMQEDPEKILISIEDNGSGLDEQDINRIFEPFQTTKKDGSGMGLAISYNLIVNLHKGGLSVIPPMHEHGMRIQIELPRNVE